MHEFAREQHSSSRHVSAPLGGLCSAGKHTPISWLVGATLTHFYLLPNAHSGLKW